MEIYNKLVKHITYPVWMIKDGNSRLYRYLSEYRGYDTLSSDEIKARQAAKLRTLLLHAVENTPYYGKLSKRVGIARADIENTKDVEALVKSLPVLNKSDIRDNLEDMKASDIDARFLHQDCTGGSTGIPLTFFRDKECILKRRAQELYFDKWIGYEIGDRVALFVAPRHMPPGIKGLKGFFRNGTCERMLAFDPGCIDEKYLESHLVTILRFKPNVIKCFPNSLYVFATFLQKRGLTVPGVRAVSCTGETLHEYQRRLFEEVFRCPVFEKYASFEIGVAACECREHRGLHMFLDGVYFEFLDNRNNPAKQGEIANIIVTDLFNYGMPLIRYKIGDVGIESTQGCVCGSNLPVMTKILGRDRDILVDENGNPKPGYLFVEIFNKNSIPGKFQVIQESRGLIVVKVVRMPGYVDAHEILIRRKIAEIVGESTKIDFRYVDDIPREASGKYKYVHSKISVFQ